MTRNNKTGGGKGTNQYRIKGTPNKIVVPLASAIQMSGHTNTTALAAATVQQRIQNARTTTSEDVLHTLAHDADPQVRREVSANNSTAPVDLAVLTRDEDFWTRMHAIENQHCPSKTLTKLAADPEEAVHNRVALHPGTPIATLERMLTSRVGRTHDGVRVCLGRNPHTPSTILDQLANDQHPLPTTGVRTSSPWETREAVSSNPNTWSTTLRRLAQDVDIPVRQAVASNPHTTSDVLATLATDPEEAVKCEVASNPATPGATLTMLAQERYYPIRLGVATNPNTPTQILHRLAVDRRQDVRIAVASNQSSDPNTLAKLAKGKEGVLRALAANPKTPVPILIALLESPHDGVRRTVMSNPSAPDYLRAIGALSS